MNKKIAGKKSLVTQKAPLSTIEVNGMAPMAAAQMAMAAGMDIEKLEKIMELQVKWEALEAKKAFVKAMAEFKKNPPTILKDKNVHFVNSAGRITDYNHASLGNVTQELNRGLSECGFSSSFKTEQLDDDVKITCTITHKMGHEESTSLKAPPDDSGGKNPVQAIASTATLLERYTLLALTGLATHDQDDDGRGGAPYNEPVYISDKQKSNIIDMIADSEAHEDTFLKFIGASSVDKIKAKSYKVAINALKKFKEEKNK